MICKTRVLKAQAENNLTLKRDSLRICFSRNPIPILIQGLFMIRASYALFCMALLPTVGLFLSADLKGAEPRPNIIVILADDMGYGDVQSLNPDSKIPTPNLNRL